MFNAAEFRTIKNNCLSEMEELLKFLSISVPIWDSGDEYGLYRQLDEEITRKVCELMKSSSIIEGYSYLLKLGNISYDFSETDNDLLNKIVDNSSMIINNYISSVNNQQPIERIQSEPVEQINVSFSQVKTLDNSELDKVLKEANECYANFSGSNLSVNLKYVLNKLGNIIDIFNNPNRMERQSKKVNVGKLLEITGTQYKYTLEDFTKEIKSKLHAGDSTSFYIKISKEIVNQEKMILEPPPQPLLDKQEVERILTILEQVNKIKKSI